MQRWAFLALCLVTAACAGAGLPPPSFTTMRGSESPQGTVMLRLAGQDGPDQPLLPQPGDIWADVLPKAASAPAPSAGAAGTGQRQSAMTASNVSQHGAGQGKAAPHRVQPVVRTAAVAAVAPPARRDAAGPMVQLAAATSAAQATAEWRRLRQRAPRLTAGHNPALEQAEIDGRQVWRLRAGGFTDLAAATAFCSGLRAVTARCWVVPASSVR